jgi:hypothetical protein
LLEEATNIVLLSEIETQFIVCDVTTPLLYPGLEVLLEVARISLLAVYGVRQKRNGPGKYVVPESAKVMNICRSLHTGRAQLLFCYHEITAYVICTYVTGKVDTMYYECKKRDRPTRETSVISHRRTDRQTNKGHLFCA